MYRFFFRTVYRARNSAVSVYELSLLPAKCDKAAVFRVANGGGVKAISTSSVRLCEKKPDVLSNHDEKTHADEKADPTESPTLATQKAEDDGTVMKMAEQREEPVVLKTDDGRTMQQQMDVKIDQSVKSQQVKTDAAKSGKEGLLDLLGAMKVEVTNKRKLKIMKVKQNHESAPKSNPASMESTISMFQKATGEASSQSVILDPELVAAASAAASTLPNCSQAESDLLKQLRQHEAITEVQKKGDMNNLGEIIADMKVGKNPNRQNARWINHIQFDDDGRGYKRDGGITSELDSVRRGNLLRVKRLNIFSPTTDADGVESAVERPTLWDMDFANQLSLLVNNMPRNALEEMIQWTKEGKMWQYPINNEAGLEVEEASVPFHEHIFLEKHLNEGFPSQGPVRHFMELVVGGLSRNPYLTVQQKREHISWFRDYFHQKEDVLKEADVYLK
ncbi:28S ribosomal protein S31, mitochondrial [Seriola aureovittata]|uniref:28S ribosomal protein S31, mitochondrial n=1 Tax=Seriola aureovittata TaxID=2871759 RepID=UPI0024BD8C86|nr:28S ribosomal protein S31, mitochondrial [Seriola aureovittata]